MDEAQQMRDGVVRAGERDEEDEEQARLLEMARRAPRWMPLVRDAVTHQRHRAQHMVEEAAQAPCTREYTCCPT